VEIETIQIGSKSIQVSSTVSFDTGLTYTYLATPIFEQFITDVSLRLLLLLPFRRTASRHLRFTSFKLQHILLGIEVLIL
jgi:hypothetical protein